jgi:hypothetical protein
MLTTLAWIATPLYWLLATLLFRKEQGGVRAAGIVPRIHLRTSSRKPDAARSLCEFEPRRSERNASKDLCGHSARERRNVGRVRSQWAIEYTK